MCKKTKLNATKTLFIVLSYYVWEIIKKLAKNDWIGSNGVQFLENALYYVYYNKLMEFIALHDPLNKF